VARLSILSNGQTSHVLDQHGRHVSNSLKTDSKDSLIGSKEGNSNLLDVYNMNLINRILGKVTSDVNKEMPYGYITEMDDIPFEELRRNVKGFSNQFLPSQVRVIFSYNNGKKTFKATKKCKPSYEDILKTSVELMEKVKSKVSETLTFEPMEYGPHPGKYLIFHPSEALIFDGIKYKRSKGEHVFDVQYGR